MSSPDLFFDSSALFAGAVSQVGAARALLVLAESALISITVSEQVIVEPERALARKAPKALVPYREMVRRARIRIVPSPSMTDVQAHAGIIAHETDVPIVVAAMQAHVDYLITLNRRHFLDDPDVAARSGLRIGMPGDGLAWVRLELSKT